MPMERHLLLRRASLRSSGVCAKAALMVLLLTCWLAGPWTWALAASMAAASAFMLSMLSVELLRPDWMVASPRAPGPSKCASCADSVLLCAVMEMKGLVAARGGTGGGAFL